MYKDIIIRFTCPQHTQPTPGPGGDTIEYDIDLG